MAWPPVEPDSLGDLEGRLPSARTRKAEPGQKGAPDTPRPGTGEGSRNWASFSAWSDTVKGLQTGHLNV